MISLVRYCSRALLGLHARFFRRARSSPGGRSAQLDVLRAAAVLLVLTCHSADYNGALVGFFRRIGWAGVDLFFVLSGFLVSDLLYRDYVDLGAVRLKRFWIRRGLKIWPSFYLLLFATVAFYGVSNFSVKRIAIESLFIQNYARGIQIHTWSLAVEEHFYIGLALLLWFLARRGRINMIPRICLLIALFSLATRCLVAIRQGANFWGALLPTHNRMDALFFGVFLAYLARFHKARFQQITRSNWILLGAALCLAPLCTLNGASKTMITAGLTLNYIGFGGLLVWSLSRETRAWMMPLAAIGRYSYSIYLWHVAVRDWIMPHLALPNPSIWHFGSYLAISAIAGALMARAVELPVLRIRDRLTADTHPPIAAAENHSQPAAMHVAPEGTS